MSGSLLENAQPPGVAATPTDIPNEAPTEPQSGPPKRPRPKKKGPNYAQLHSKPLPLQTYPLPPFHPSHPLSLIHLCYVYLSHFFSPPSARPSAHYIGYFSPSTRSVNVTDAAHIRALWEMGFFGKGTLSRSEPSWLDRERARLKAERGGRGGGTAEEATNARREERRLFKLERARVERAKIERQRAVEEGSMSVEEAAKLEAQDDEKPDHALGAQVGVAGSAGPLSVPIVTLREAQDDETRQPLEAEGRVPDAVLLDPAKARADEPAPNGVLAADLAPTGDDDLLEAEPVITNQEYLQLTLEEAFFLSYGLGVLDVISNDTSARPTQANTNKPSELMTLFSRYCFFPPKEIDAPAINSLDSLAPDNPFLLNYVVYHHFRSLGWVVRPGVKFAVDYLLYNRGPVFSHAEFAVLVVPAYTHSFWESSEGRRSRRVQEQKDWWWLHCVNRVQSQVRKSLVLCYVDVPPPVWEADDETGRIDVGGLLRRYEVREFVLRRWVANRSRD